MKKSIPLYEVPEKSLLKVDVFEADKGKSTNQIVTFHHIDGMYSYITMKDGRVLHLHATTLMEKVGDYYQIAKKQHE